MSLAPTRHASPSPGVSSCFLALSSLNRPFVSLPRLRAKCCGPRGEATSGTLQRSARLWVSHGAEEETAALRDQPDTPEAGKGHREVCVAKGPRGLGLAPGCCKCRGGRLFLNISVFRVLPSPVWQVEILSPSLPLPPVLGCFQG